MVDQALMNLSWGFIGEQNLWQKKMLNGCELSGNNIKIVLGTL